MTSMARLPSLTAMTERFPDLRQILGVQPVQSRLGIVDPAESAA